MKRKKISYQQIGIIHTHHKKIEGIPIQPSGAKGIYGEIEIFEEFKPGLKDLEGFSHIILIYDFHKSKSYSLQVKPFLDDKLRGVFATRAPQRPNPIGISVLKLNRIVDNKLYVENADILNGTPIIDIKPYVSQFDAVENERIGWLTENIKVSEIKKSNERFSY